MEEVQPLETHANWTTSDVADSGLWTYRWSPSDIAEIEAALVFARSKVKVRLDMRKEDFPLPTLTPTLASVPEELINGRDFQLTSAPPVERVGSDASSWMF